MFKKTKQWLIFFTPLYPFVVLALDRLTKDYALKQGTYTLNHPLFFLTSGEFFFNIGIILIILFVACYFFSTFFFQTQNTHTDHSSISSSQKPLFGKVRFYLYRDFIAHVLILGSIASNADDLFRLGGVIDWIDLWIAKTNMSDLGIISGITLLVLRRR